MMVHTSDIGDDLRHTGDDVTSTGHMTSSKVHKLIIGNNSRTKGDKDSDMVSLCLSRQTASSDMQHDLLYFMSHRVNLT